MDAYLRHREHHHGGIRRRRLAGDLARAAGHPARDQLHHDRDGLHLYFAGSEGGVSNLSRKTGEVCVLTYNVDALNVSHWSMSPVWKPRWNQRTRCALEPCVKLSGTT